MSVSRELLEKLNLKVMFKRGLIKEAADPHRSFLFGISFTISLMFSDLTQGRTTRLQILIATLIGALNLLPPTFFAEANF